MATIIGLLGIWLILTSSIYCRQFGYNNSLTCNCNNEESCQDSGICSTGVCKQGWSGPTCQKENVALHKPSKQSSYFRSDWPSSRGVDGNINTFIDMNSSKQGWWFVNLLQNYPITDITLYNRPGFLQRLRGFYIQILDEDLVSSLCYHHTNEPLTLVYKIRCNSTGYYVVIRSANNPEYPTDRNPNGILNLSEVEIYVCSVGTYGPHCANVCHCSQYTRCDDITGYCKDGCLPGWHGNSCNQSCSDMNSYGDRCKYNCDDRKCNGKSDCDHVTGTCLYGCQDGWESQDCAKMCSQGNYGERCRQLCSDRGCKAGDSTCDHVNGTCVGGCKAGWRSHDCTLDCEIGFYGEGCMYKCSERKCLNVTSSSCDHINGECDKGCEEGYDGIDCIGLVRRNNGKMSLPVEIIAPAVAGVVVLIIVIVVVATLLVRRRGRRTSSQAKDVDGVNVAAKNPRLAIVQPRKRPREKDYEEHHDIHVYATIKYEEPDLSANKITNFDKETEAATSVNHYETVSIDEDDKSLASMDTYIPTEVQTERSSDPPIESEDSNYYNLLNINTDLKLDQFESFFIKTKDGNDFKLIFLSLPNDFTASFDISQKPENRSKNRFRGYYPYDYSRVVLQKSKTDPHSDYINANYIDGFKKPKAYIAAQGATKVTKNDFVRMIWEQKCDKVIMLTTVQEHGKIKCEQYWPEQGSQKFGEINLTLNEERVRADFTVRCITMSKGTETREFHHFHYTSWPDHDVPNVSDLLDFLYMVNKHKPNSNKPEIVHCSAGVGRTGTYIAIDCGLKIGEQTGHFDVIEFTKTMRNQRKGMIQTDGQFQFVYEALTEGFKYGDNSSDQTVFESKFDSKQEPMQVGTLSLKTQYGYLRQIKPESRNTDTPDSIDESLPVSFPSRTNLNGYIVAALNGHNTESIWQLIQNKQCSVVVALLNRKNEVAICPEVGTEETFGSLKLESKTDVDVSEEENMISVSTSQEVRQLRMESRWHSVYAIGR
ncbi:receptor-type tyrosine-protein phosphatase T isoform X2 [Patella vulgata]|uniref:receptor-type tyrosine-protein phosphatase T isoform X2 n=1 Tax=Patella vulgata TaxID=6465 RepID=UPI0024A82B13|nr:receptor-type tyrosine-protein phosphatase T isoform X2 [Patella vulgata]